MLAIPLLATLTSVAILALFSVRDHPVVMSLATLTLLLAVARTFVTFRQVQRLSDARRQAVTDHAVAQRFGDVRAADLFGTGEIGEGAGDFQYAVVRPGRELEALGQEVEVRGRRVSQNRL